MSPPEKVSFQVLSFLSCPEPPLLSPPGNGVICLSVIKVGSKPHLLCHCESDVLYKSILRLCAQAISVVSW